MFEFLYIFGPAAVTYLIVTKLSGKQSSNFLTTLIELVAYAVIDAALTVLFLMPSGRVEFVLNAIGIRELRYGESAFFLSLVFSVLIGVLFGIIEKRVDIQLRISKAPEERENEEDSAE